MSYTKLLEESINIEQNEIYAQQLYKKDVLKNYTIEPREDFITAFSSREYIPLSKTITLCKLLSFIKHKYNETLSSDQQERLNRNLSTLKYLLNSLEEGGYNFTSFKDLVLNKKSTYGYTKFHTHGRLYSNLPSIVQLSREFRYILFKDLYHDVDIINAHPTILLNFAKEENIETPSLSHLVNDRDEFYETVRLQYAKNINETFSEKLDIKRLSLAVINSNKTEYKSELLNDLSKDMSTIRTALKIKFYDSNESFKSAIDFRLKEIDLDYQSAKMSKIQSLYCFDKETETILNFKQFLEERAGKIDSIVPFFDGLYILKDDLKFDTSTVSFVRAFDLESIITEYNKINTLKFKLKTIEPDFKLITPTSMQTFEEAIDKINKSSFSELEQFIPKELFDNVLYELYRENKKKYVSISFSYETLLKLQEESEKAYNTSLDYFLSELTDELILPNR